MLREVVSVWTCRPSGVERTVARLQVRAVAYSLMTCVFTTTVAATALTDGYVKKPRRRLSHTGEQRVGYMKAVRDVPGTHSGKARQST